MPPSASQTKVEKSRRKSGASRTVPVGLIQARASHDPAANLAQAVSRIEQAAKRGAEIICLQELFSCRYFPREENGKWFRLAETIPGPVTDRLSKLARRRRVVLIVPLFEKRAEGIYHNTAVVLDADGTLLGKYRKMHIPDDPGYYEKFYFTPGDLGFNVFKTRYAKIGALICWDQWFPEAARLAALKGAEILFYPTAIGWNEHDEVKDSKKEQAAWELIQRAHAIANGVFVAVVNRVGSEGNLKFWGRSFVCDPLGALIARAGGRGEEVLVTRLDLASIGETRRHWPFLRDRRIDAYQAITNRFLDA
jgi:N-carbamoylputrescine amidase